MTVWKVGSSTRFFFLALVQGRKSPANGVRSPSSSWWNQLGQLNHSVLMCVTGWDLVEEGGRMKGVGTIKHWAGSAEWALKWRRIFNGRIIVSDGDFADRTVRKVMMERVFFFVEVVEWDFNLIDGILEWRMFSLLDLLHFVDPFQKFCYFNNFYFICATCLNDI